MLAAAALSAAATAAAPPGAPVNTDCITWLEITDKAVQAKHPLFVGHQEYEGNNGTFDQQVCTAHNPLTGAGMIGHRNWLEGSADGTAPGGAARATQCCWVPIKDAPDAPENQISEFWLATPGKTDLTWTKYTKGQPVPSNAYEIGGLLLGRSDGAVSVNPHGTKGNVMSGWVSVAGSTLGTMNYEDYGANAVDSYYLATCHPPTQLAWGCHASNHSCVAVPVGTPGSSKTQQECAAKCTPPPPPPPTPVPTPAPPLGAAPCIRFGQAMPVPNDVSVTIEQTTPANGHIHTWSNYAFAQFSEWQSAFTVGVGKVTVRSGGQTVVEVADVPLTPGPLVIVLKCQAGRPCEWPPTSTQLGDNIEAIAASFDPVVSGAHGRLFNLSPDLKKAALSVAGQELVSDVQYSLGSEWVSVPNATSTYAAIDEGTKASVATVSYTPDAAPVGLGVFTMWLLGTPAGAQPARLLPLADAPDGERCTPTMA